MQWTLQARPSMGRRLFRFALMIVLVASTLLSAEYRDPFDFSSLGSFNSLPGPYSIDTDTLVMSGPSGFRATGVVDGLSAVFVFDDFSLGGSSQISAFGSRTLAILSQSDAFVGGMIDVASGGGAGGEPRQRGQGPGGGFASTNFFGGAGGGGGFGGGGGRGQRSDPTFEFPGAGGPTYGDLSTQLEAGSGGGGGYTNVGFQSAGGDGGGGLELAAHQSILISGSIHADGQPGQPRGNDHTGGGGGSGGGILVHAPTVDHSGLISVIGGRGGDGVFENGGGGGGGRILVDTSPFGLTNAGFFDVRGGTAPSDFFGSGVPGMAGAIEFRTTVPEPTQIALVLPTILALLVWWRHSVHTPVKHR